MPRLSSLVATTVVLALTGCGDGGVEPNIPREEIAGSYRVAALEFDPSGSLPAVDLRATLVARGKPDPALTLLEDGRLQLLFEDPASRLLRLVEGTFRTTPEGVFMDLGGSGAYRALGLSRRMTYERTANGSLRFSGPAPDGFQRAALLVLVPEWEQEPLLDPVPGEVTVLFTPEQ